MPIRVCSFESRRGSEMAALIRRHGGQPTVAPSMREAPLERQEAVFSFWDRLTQGRIDLVMLLTGVGTQTVFDVLLSRVSREELVAEMNRHPIVIRGPKPAAVLNQWNVRIDYRAPEPNTWRELLGVLDEAPFELAGRTVAVQEYGRPNDALDAGLRERGATVLPVPVYRWELPADIGPLRAAVQSTIAGDFDVLLFTSAQQVHHVLEIARRDEVEAAWLAAARNCFVGSIGPTATETLLEVGLPPDCEPAHPKMGPLVAAALSAASAAQ